MGRDVNHQWSKSIDYEIAAAEHAVRLRVEPGPVLLAAARAVRVRDRRPLPRLPAVLPRVHQLQPTVRARPGTPCRVVVRALPEVSVRLRADGAAARDAPRSRRSSAGTCSRTTTIAPASRTSSDWASTSPSNASASTTKPPSRCWPSSTTTNGAACRWSRSSGRAARRSRRSPPSTTIGSEVDYVPARYAALPLADFDDVMVEPHTDLAGLVVGIWGFGLRGHLDGQDGRGRGCRAASSRSTTQEARPLDVPDGIAGLTVLRGAEHLDRLRDCDVVFVSPGVPWRHPFFEELREFGQADLERRRLVHGAQRQRGPSASPAPRARARPRRSWAIC